MIPVVGSLGPEASLGRCSAVDEDTVAVVCSLGWKVEQFGDRQEEIIQSPPISVNCCNYKSQWALLCRPNTPSNHVAIFLWSKDENLQALSTCNRAYPAASCSFTCRNGRDKENNATTRTFQLHVFTVEESDWGFSRFESRDTILSHRLSSEESLIFEVEFTVHHPKVVLFGQADKMQKLFASQQFGDFVFRCPRNRQIRAYKGLLAMHSPVFAAMFEWTVEAQLNETEVKDVDADTLGHLISFVYSGLISFDANYAKLFAAADKYQIQELKMACAKELKSGLSVRSACEYLLLAYLHCDNDLKRAAIEFVVQHWQEVEKSEDWARVRANQDLIDELFSAFARENRRLSLQQPSSSRKSNH